MVGLVGVEAKLRAQLQRCSEREPRESSAKSQAEFKRVKPCSRENDLRLARCFSTVQLGPAHGRLVESDCPYGAEPRPCPGLLGWNF